MKKYNVSTRQEVEYLMDKCMTERTTNEVLDHCNDLTLKIELNGGIVRVSTDKEQVTDNSSYMTSAMVAMLYAHSQLAFSALDDIYSNKQSDFDLEELHHAVDFQNEIGELLMAHIKELRESQIND